MAGFDANRTIEQPNKITVIFGRKITKQHRGKLQTEIEDMHLPNPVIRSHHRNGFIKQYVCDHPILRTEAATNNVTDHDMNKAIEHLPALRDKLAAINNNYLDVQHRWQLRHLAKPTCTPSLFLVLVGRAQAPVWDVSASTTSSAKSRCRTSTTIRSTSSTSTGAI